MQGVSGVVESLKIITQEKSYRIAKYAFDYAVRYNRKKVTAIHKANIMWVKRGWGRGWREVVVHVYTSLHLRATE